VHFEVSVAPLVAVEALTVRGKLLWDDEINGIVFERCFSGRPDQRVGCFYWWLCNAWNVVLLPDVLSTRPIAKMANVITTENPSLLAPM
jgi:hypothetical protein